MWRLLLVGLLGCSFSGVQPGAPSDGGPDSDGGPGEIDADPGESDADPGERPRRRTITVTSPVNTDVTDVAVPVRLEGDADLIASAAASGDDLLFQLPDGTRLPHDIERFDQQAGALIAWVVLPALPSAGATFELYYGGGNVAPTPATNTWDGLADLVFHFETSQNPLPDHAGGGNDGVHEPLRTFALTEGAIGDALELSTSSIGVPDATAANRGTESFALGFWFHQDAAVDSSDLAWFKGGFGGFAGYQVALGEDEWRANLQGETAEVVQVDFGLESELKGPGFVHLVLVVDRENELALTYTNGAFVDSADIPNDFGSLSNLVTPAVVGGQMLRVDGDFDELRAYTGALTAAWIEVDNALGRNSDLVSVGDAVPTAYPAP